MINVKLPVLIVNVDRATVMGRRDTSMFDETMSLLEL